MTSGFELLLAGLQAHTVQIAAGVIVAVQSV
jgi:hypothetical protein